MREGISELLSMGRWDTSMNSMEMGLPFYITARDAKRRGNLLPSDNKILHTQITRRQYEWLYLYATYLKCGHPIVRPCTAANPANNLLF